MEALYECPSCRILNTLDDRALQGRCKCGFLFTLAKNLHKKVKRLRCVLCHCDVDVPLDSEDHRECPKCGQFNTMSNLLKPINEAINSPAHYHPGTYEAYKVIESWSLGFHLGNVVKYISRAGHKPSQGQTKEQKYCEDIEKSIWYARREIERVKEGGKI